MEEHGAATIHFEVKVAFGHIRTGCEEELNTTIPTDTILMLSGYCPNVSVFDAEHHIYRYVIVGDLQLRLWKMVGSLSHEVAEEFGRNLLPRRLIPICTSRRRVWQPRYFSNHIFPLPSGREIEP